MPGTFPEVITQPMGSLLVVRLASTLVDEKKERFMRSIYVNKECQHEIAFLQPLKELHCCSWIDKIILSMMLQVLLVANCAPRLLNDLQRCELTQSCAIPQELVGVRDNHQLTFSRNVPIHIWKLCP